MAGAVRISKVRDLVVVAAEALLPDKRLLSAKREVALNANCQGDFVQQARRLACINNPALGVRGSLQHAEAPVDFRQAAFEFGHGLYQTYLSGEVMGVIPVVLSYNEKADLRMEIAEDTEELPWEALHDGNDFVSLKVRFSRSCGELTERAQDNAIEEDAGILLIGADSRGDLPGVETEVHTIGSLLTSAGTNRVEVLSRAQASRNRVADALGSCSFNVLHFSGHSFFDEQHPFQSYLELAQGGRLYLHELGFLTRRAGRRVPLQLVFLNSCQSAKVGQDRTTGRNISMCKMLRESGVQNAIGMMWNVADDAAAQVGSVFYSLILTGARVDPVEAMRQTRCRIAIDRSWIDGSWLAPALYT
jgi:hypothetical protein